jgi:hypothetical protein
MKRKETGLNISVFVGNYMMSGWLLVDPGMTSSPRVPGKDGSFGEDG